MYQDQLLKANLAVLERRNPALCEKIRAAAIPLNLEVFAAKNGMPTARISTPTGEAALHSRYDPIKEATRFVDANGFGEKDDYVLMGFGFGYVAEEIMSRLAKHQHALIVEADPGLLRAALALRDFTQLLESPSILLYTCDQPERFALELNDFFNSFFREDITVVNYPVSIRLNGELYRKARKEIDNAANKRIVDLQTAIVLGPKCQANIIDNSIVYLSSSGIEPAKGTFAGKPAIIVAAGPSLDKNIGLLAEARHSALLISVGTVFKKLLSADARPHIVVSMDPSAISYKYFEDLPPVDDIFLAADPEVYPGILADYPGPKLIIDIDTPITRWLRTLSGPKGKLEKGRTVAHTAYYLAEHLGADPIIFVGLDLCFPDGKAHADGCDAAWGANLDIETEKGIVMMRGIDGQMHPTRKNFLNFLTIFENIFAQTGKRIIDATEGGALKRGAEVMTLRRALDECAREQFDSAAVLRRSLGPPPQVDLNTCVQQVAGIISSLARIRSVAGKGLKMLEKLERLLKNKKHDAPPVELLKRRINDCNIRLLAEKPAIAFVQRNMINTKIFFESRNIMLIEQMSPGTEKVRMEMKRTAVFFEDTLASARQLSELFRDLKAKPGARPVETRR